MELQAPRGREVLVERLADQLVHERVAPRDSGILGDHARVLGLGEDVEQPRHIEPDGPLEHAQVELAADDGGHVQHLDRAVGQVGHASSQEGPDLLGTRSICPSRDHRRTTSPRKNGFPPVST